MDQPPPPIGIILRFSSLDKQIKSNSNDIKIERIFDPNLLIKYPNCIFSLVINDDQSGLPFDITDMSVKEYDEMITVLKGTKKIEECNERLIYLLDSYGFIDRIENKIIETSYAETKSLVKRIKSFYYGKNNSFICETEKIYKNCKEWFKDKDNIVPIQIITIANMLIFCSFDDGVPLYATYINKNNIDSEMSRLACIPTRNMSIMSSTHDLLLKSHIDNTPSTNDHKKINGVNDMNGYKMKNGLQNVILDNADNTSEWCSYCGNSNHLKCNCEKTLLNMHINNIMMTRNGIICINSMFFLMCQTLSMCQPSSLNYDIRRNPFKNNRTKEEKMLILSHIRSIDLANSIAIKTNIIFNYKPIKVSLHLGFVYLKK